MARKKRRNHNGEIVLGLCLFVFGTLLLLDNVDILEVGSVWGYWPFIIVAFGVNKLFNSQNRKETGSGVWLVFLGLWLFVSIQHLFGLGFWDTWPMLIIAWGVSEIWKALGQRSQFTFAKEQHNAD